MFNVSFKLSNKKSVLILVTLFLTAVVLVTLRFKSVTAQKPQPKKCSGTEDIIAYLNDFGLEVDNCAIDEITVPSQFGKVYSDYNEIQKSQGFDLSQYKGMSLTRYTFRVMGEKDCFVEVLIYKSTIVGADVYSVAADGFIKALK